jgi:hypothetical protein
MAYQPLSKLISQTPTTKELHITTDNWPEERKKQSEIVKDPQNPNFNWWFYCGVSNKQGLLDLVNDYKQISGSLLHFKDKKEPYIQEWFKDKIKNRIHRHFMIKSIYQINADSTRMFTYFSDIFKNEDVLKRILYTIFSQRYVLFEGYSQTDMYTLLLITQMLEFITKPQIDIYNTKLNISTLKEVLVYSILTKLLDLKISTLYVLETKIKINEISIDLLKDKNKSFLLENFFQFLFSTLFLKFLDDKEVKTEILSHPKKKQIFSSLCESSRSLLWAPHPFVDMDIKKKNGKKFLKIIGQTIIDNDLITYIIYIIAFWCKYFKKKHITNLQPPVDPDKHPFLQQVFFARECKQINNEIFSNTIPHRKVAEIREWLLKSLRNLDGSRYKRLDSIIAIAKKKQTTKKYKNRYPILFRYPSNLLHKGSKGGRRGKKTIKYRRPNRRKTLKL